MSSSTTSGIYQGKSQDNLMNKTRELIEEYNQENGIDEKFIELSKDQQLALDLFKEGKNLLILGSGGTGKSKLIQEMTYHTSKCTSKNIVVTATTGIAAYNINGLTIHSFMGIGTGDQNIDILIRKIRSKPPLRDRIRNVDILVIDEISMMSAELFEKINAICQTIRRSAAPFGGIQVVLTGDLLQLLPVFNKNVELFQDQDTRLIFESKVFTTYFNSNNIVNLKQNFRQSDKVFLGILNRMRVGENTKDDINILKSRFVSKLLAKDNIRDAVHLVASNKQAQEINRMNLETIKDKGTKYRTAYFEDGDPELTKELKKELQNQFMQKGINEIELKKNARVMLLKNLSVEEGLVNGSVGTIIEFDNGYPIVKFDNGPQRIITPVEWELKLSGSVCKAAQVPMMLCWAITIHKSQSLTLEKAVLELGGCFCEHQVYVALSRVRSLNGLYILSFSVNKVQVSQKVKDYLKDIDTVTLI